jgi:hypothetical protein
MNSEIFFLVEESLEGGYEARAVGHSIFTQAETIDKIKEMIKDAVTCHFEPEECPRIIRLHFSKEEILSL